MRDWKNGGNNNCYVRRRYWFTVDGTCWLVYVLFVVYGLALLFLDT